MDLQNDWQISRRLLWGLLALARTGLRDASSWAFCKSSGTLTRVLEPVAGFCVADLTLMCRPASLIASVCSVGHIVVLDKLQEVQEVTPAEVAKKNRIEAEA